MPLTFEEILESYAYPLTAEERLRIKKRAAEKIIDLYFENDLGEELQQRVVAWLLDGDNAEAKEAAMRRRFYMIFGEEPAEESMTGETIPVA